MNERCQDCPKRILAEPRINRIEITYREALAQIEQFDEKIEQCNLWDILKGSRRSLRHQRDGFKNETYSPAATEFILTIGEKHRFEECAGPLERTTPIDENFTWRETACGAAVLSTIGSRIDRVDQPTD